MVKNNRGITLVEVLSGLALFSMIAVLAFSFHLFSQKQFSSQKNQIETQEEMRIAINQMEKDIRSATDVTVNNNVLTINNTDVYKLENSVIKKNDQAILTEIQTFNVTKSNRKITLLLESKQVSNGQRETFRTTIYTRE